MGGLRVKHDWKKETAARQIEYALSQRETVVYATAKGVLRLTQKRSDFIKVEFLGNQITGGRAETVIFDELGNG